jgi:uncharacterized protein (DUF934 family)
MALVRNGIAQPDEWVRLADEAPLPEAGKVLVSLKRWLAERETLGRARGRIGIVLANSQSPELLAPDLAGLALVALDFPKFTDGRAFSQARLLRDKLNYRGEIRALGQVLRDQYLFMLRCGIDSAEIPDGKKIGGYAEAMREFSVWYQPASDDRPFVFRQRHDIPERIAAQ